MPETRPYDPHGVAVDAVPERIDDGPVTTPMDLDAIQAILGRTPTAPIDDAILRDLLREPTPQ
jgi:hypothetical protein